MRHEVSSWVISHELTQLRQQPPTQQPPTQQPGSTQPPPSLANRFVTGTRRSRRQLGLSPIKTNLIPPRDNITFVPPNSPDLFNEQMESSNNNECSISATNQQGSFNQSNSNIRDEFSISQDTSTMPPPDLHNIPTDVTPNLPPQ